MAPAWAWNSLVLREVLSNQQGTVLLCGSTPAINSACEHMKSRREVSFHRLCALALLHRASWFVFLIVPVVVLPISNAHKNPFPLTRETPLWFAKAPQIGYDASAFTRTWMRVGVDQAKPQFLDDHRLAFWLKPTNCGRPENCMSEKPAEPGIYIRLPMTINR